jgi:RNA polymerase sigma factor (sigma-70 family)
VGQSGACSLWQRSPFRSRMSRTSRFHQLADDADFQEFAAAFLPTLLRAAYLLLRDIDLAEDAVQGTLLRVFRHWPEARNSPEAYSRVTLVNVCREHWSRLRPRPTEALPGGTDPIGPSGEENFADAWAESRAVEHALANLPTPQREVLILRLFLELSVQETAAVLDIAESVVESSIHRGLRELRDILAPAEGVNQLD